MSLADQHQIAPKSLEGGGSALEGDDASGTVLKVEDEHAADALVLYRTERQVVDEDHRCFAVNSVSRTRR